MVSPTLFPDGLGDPADNATVCDNSKSETNYNTQKLYMVRFSEFINGKIFLPFCCKFFTEGEY